MKLNSCTQITVSWFKSDLFLYTISAFNRPCKFIQKPKIQVVFGVFFFSPTFSPQFGLTISHSLAKPGMKRTF